MIGFLRGTLESVTDNTLIIDVGGVGYEVGIPSSVIPHLPDMGEEVRLYTYMSVSESAVSLYGFLRKEELDMFKLLISVNKIGPKGAVSILSVLSASQLIQAVSSGDVKAISKAPGIGSRTAQRIVLELAGRMPALDLAVDAGTADAHNEKSKAEQEAEEALMALGYSAVEAGNAVRMVENGEQMDVNQLLSAALKNMI